MEDETLVSIIIPAYNHEKYIEAALQSIAKQTYKNIETVVIDDGSTDGTAKKIREFITSNPEMQIFFLSKKNEGVCQTLNIGIDHARGEYLCFLASDDIFLPKKIASQVEFLEQNLAIGMVFSDAIFLRFNEKSNTKWSDYKPGIKSLFRNGIQNVNMYRILITRAIIPALTVMVRRSVIEEIGKFDNNLSYEDDDMWLRISERYPIAYIDEPLALYRMHGNNVSNNSKFMIKGMLETVSKHYRNGLYSNKPLMKILLLIQLLLNTIYYRLKRVIRLNKFPQNTKARMKKGL